MNTARGKALIFDNARIGLVAASMTYLWSLTGEPVGYSQLMPLLYAMNFRSSGRVYAIIRRLSNAGFIEGVNVGRYGTRIRYKPTRYLIAELMLNCPWTSTSGCNISFINEASAGGQSVAGDVIQGFINWVRELTSTISSSEAQLVFLGMNIKAAGAIKSYWRSRDEYLRDLKRRISSITGTMGTGANPTSLYYGLYDSYVNDFINFLKWLSDEEFKPSNDELLSRVVYCLNPYTQHFHQATSLGAFLQSIGALVGMSAALLSWWLTQENLKQLLNNLNLYDLYKRIMEYNKNNVHNKIEKCLEMRNKVRGMLESSEQE